MATFGIGNYEGGGSVALDMILVIEVLLHGKHLLGRKRKSNNCVGSGL